MLIEIVPPAQTGDVGDLSAAILEGIDGALSPVGEVLHEEVSQRFETQTDPQGRPWAPLTPKTLIARARKTDFRAAWRSLLPEIEKANPRLPRQHHVALAQRAAREQYPAGTKILIVTAMLKNSFAPRIQRDQRRVSIGPGGPAAAYAATHQFGRGGILPRPMLPVGPGGPPSAALVAEVRATIAESVRAALARYRARRGQR